jgi:hypothetical protein
VIRSKVLEQMLPMSILDAEYQFDRHKLTFFFEADRRIDFRELVSELFSLYKTRIWMQQVDTTVLGQHDPGTELAKATGFLPMERDDFAYYQQNQLYRSMTDESSSGGLPMMNSLHHHHHHHPLQSNVSTPTAASTAALSLSRDNHNRSTGLIGGYSYGGTELDLQMLHPNNCSSPVSLLNQSQRKLGGSSQLYGLGNSNNNHLHRHSSLSSSASSSSSSSSSSLLFPDDDFFSSVEPDGDTSVLGGSMNIMSNNNNNNNDYNVRSNSNNNNGWNFRAM